MRLFLLARGRGVAELIEKLLEGDPVAFAILGGALVLTGLVFWLSFYLEKQRGQRLADGIGGCTYKFAPDGLFGKRVFLISGNWENIRFSLESHKTQKKGEHRRILRIEKPSGVTWSQIEGKLGESCELMEAVQDIAESPEEIALAYLGDGAGPQEIRTLLSAVASASGTCDVAKQPLS